METQPTPELDYHAALAALEWQLEMGVDTVIGDTPVDCYELPDKSAQAKAKAPEAAPVADRELPPVAQMAKIEGPDPVVVAGDAAGKADTLEALRAAIDSYDMCDLKLGARNTVFADGKPAARVMIIGEAPGREEDQKGLPFVGRAGQLLDKMFGAIGLSRQSPDAEAALYITNVLPWRPPGNRDPSPAEIAQMLPFLARHVDLADPDLIVLMGNAACAAALGKRGILRLRGTWAEAFGRPTLPMTHPAYLLRNPAAKREAWADLLQIRARLDQA
ncbi:uracil-DNA glycosylase [Thioclava sp. DLFJ5-1]|uniref:uracil-DNA glycosylase n=1 Tax=unclassified Thioclava TaxID=2621713 RepID=UPI000998D525|nr:MULTISPECIES: uracil-DNA glycosylase [unclassified Thioclava]OOY07957.1 uracil-DNA glycosylase [Thioclava sp. F36-7]OOY22088.1 uracil-DNA glycosylase [Thioclava sp. DLFJ5-1]